MIVKIITIEPKSKKPNQKVKCRDCGITYSFKDYAILYPLKKLNYLKIHDEDRSYCHDCCVKRMVSIKTQFPEVVFIIITGEEQKVIDLK